MRLELNFITNTLPWPFLVLHQQYLEALAMLDVKQQMVALENVCHDKSGFTEVSGLEVGKQVGKLNKREIFYFPFLHHQLLHILE